VAVRGEFGHASFITPSEPLVIRVLDVIPPEPAKLHALASRALSVLPDLPAVLRYETIDIRSLASGAAGPVMLPCRASGADVPGAVFLDQAPDGGCSTLVGCDLSGRIYKEIYGRDVERIEMCPWKLAPRDGVPTLVKCCRVREKHVIDGDIAVVPWGASVSEVAEAARSLIRSRT